MKKRFSRVYLEITNICNRSCSFCPGTKRAPRMIDTEDFRKAAEAIRPYTDYVYLHVMGEPLCHPELKSLIEIAVEAGLKCAITTNGTLLKKRGEELLSSGLYKANISLHSFEDGDADTHNCYLDECFDFADVASKSGILTVLRLWNRGHDGGKNDDVLGRLRARFQDGEWVESPRGIRVRDKLHLEWGDRFEWPDEGAELGDESVFCYGLCDHIGVLCDGTVVPCCLDRDGVLALGNLFEEPLEDIIRGERAEAIRRGFESRIAAEDFCRRCGYARRFSR